MPIKNWFPTSVYVDDLLKQGLTKFNRELLEQCYLVRDTDPEGQEWSETNYVGGYTSYGSITDLHLRYPHFEELGRALKGHARRYARGLDMDLQGGELRLVTLWVNIMPTYVTHSLHLHPLSVISGTYYVSVPRGASSIKFEDPRLSKFMAAPPKRDGAAERNLPFQTLAPKAGQVALWESWLRHEVPANRASQDRVSISFNFDWV